MDSNSKSKSEMEDVLPCREYREIRKEFLNNRRRRVVLVEAFSDWENVSSGVPQGSAIGPLFFVNFINDLPEAIKLPIKMYADDSKVMCELRKNRAADDARRLQSDIDRIKDGVIDSL